MSETFFENPIYVYFALAFAELVLAAIWHGRRSRRLAFSLLAPPLLAGAVALVAHLVVTDREQIIANARDIAAAIEQRQPRRIPQHLDDNFAATILGAPIGKLEVVAVCDASIEPLGITRVTFYGVDVQVAGREARMHLPTILTYGQNQKSRLIWDVVWIKRDGKWLVLDVAEPRP